jgi:CheY-like chemotaxis protein
MERACIRALLPAAQKLLQKEKQNFPHLRPVCADTRGMTKPAHVLLIDDEESIVRVVGEVLHAMGYEISMATSGRDGLQTANSMRPDAIVCDVRMPELGGEEVVSMLRAQPDTTHIPIVLVSGYCEPAFAHIADAFLPKPFLVTELSSVIGNVLADARERRAA